MIAISPWKKSTPPMMISRMPAKPIHPAIDLVFTIAS
jgi:hypothetical protein